MSDTLTNAAPAQGEQTTIEDLLHVISRIAANDPHTRCRVAAGPLAPVATALNELVTVLDRRRASPPEQFGLQALVEQSPNLMLTCDTSARYRYLNYSLAGLVPEDLVGRSFYDFVVPSELERVQNSVKRVLETGERDGYEISFTREGHTTWFAVRLGPIKAPDGKVVGFTSILTDVTPLKETQARLEQSLEELRRSNRELESFASVASHDLQEPLRKILAFGARLESTSANVLSPEGRDSLGRMMNAAIRMRRLIDDLLTYSRLTSRAKPFVRVDLAQVVSEVMDDMATTIEQTGASLSVGELPTLEADPTQMRQLIQNLLSNALKFHREGEPPRISVSATVNTQANQCELRVEDNGIGFDEKYLDRIFEIFQRLHGRGRYEGTGIGLTLCRKIVERHHGTITARSTLGQGATFIVTLPLVAPSPGK